MKIYSILHRHIFIMFSCKEAHVFSFYCRIPPKKARQKFLETCCVCKTPVLHYKRHLLRDHLPWYVNPSCACVDCQFSEGYVKQLRHFHINHRGISGDFLSEAWFLAMNGLFWYIVRILGLGSLDDLLRLVAGMFEESPKHFGFLPEEIRSLKEYDRQAGLEPLADDQYSEFPPSRIIVLSNQILLSSFVTKLATEAKEVFNPLFCQYVNFDGSNAPIDHPVFEIGVIDSHFYMDRVMLSSNQFTARSGLKNSDITPRVHLVNAIANYVCPSSWDSIELHIKDARLGFTLGLHPHMVTKANQAFYLHKLELLCQQYPQALGVGDIGYDLTYSCSHRAHHDKEKCEREQHHAQLQFLRQGILLAKRVNKVLVLNIKDSGDGQASKTVLDSLIELGMNDHLIHRHCFTGDEAECRAWKDALPNCYFGISPRSLKTPSTLACLKIVDEVLRLILETDAPCLTQPNPWCVYQVAKEAAEHLSMSVPEIFKKCNKNSAKLYSLPWF